MDEKAKSSSESKKQRLTDKEQKEKIKLDEEELGADNKGNIIFCNFSNLFFYQKNPIFGKGQQPLTKKNPKNKKWTIISKIFSCNLILVSETFLSLSPHCELDFYNFCLFFYYRNYSYILNKHLFHFDLKIV